MLSSGNSHSWLVRPRNTLLLVGVAILACAGAFLWNMRDAPIRSHLDAGSTLLAQGQVAAAESQWKEATRLDPSNIQAWELLGDLYFNTHDYSKAQDAFTRALQGGSSTPDLATKAAVCALQANDTKAARRFCEEALSQNEDDVQALGVLAQVEKIENHREAHLKVLQHLAALQPKNTDVLLALATDLALAQNFQDLLPIAQSLVESKPDSNTSYFLRGLAYFNGASAQTDLKAESDFRKASEMNPQDPEPHRFLGLLYLRQNKPDKAIQEFLLVGKQRPFASAHLLELSQALRRAGRTQEAEQTQALFAHLKRLNQQMMDLRDRATLFPQDSTPVIQLAALLLGCVQNDGKEFELYRYRYLNGTLESVGAYVNQARQRPHSSNSGNTLKNQAESSYAFQLQVAEKSLEQRNFSAANRAMSRAILIHPNDERTRKLLARFSAANQNPLGTLPSPSPNSAFFH